MTTLPAARPFKLSADISMTWLVEMDAGGWIVDSSSSNCDELASLHRESAVADIGARDSANIKAVSSRVIAFL